MAQIFISYSRRDQVFAKRLFNRISEDKIEGWADWEGIPYGSEWQKTILQNIDAAQIFVFVITADSLQSRVCNLELEHARKRNKRVVPIMRREPVMSDVAGEWYDKPWEGLARANWQHLQSLNWVGFLKRTDPQFDCAYDPTTRQVLDPACDGVESDAEPFEPAFQKLLKAIQIDPLHLDMHTAFLVRAVNWETNKGGVLRANELTVAEAWLVGSEGKNPAPTELHRQFIVASRRNANRERRVVLGSLLVGITIALALAAFSFVQYQNSEVERNRANLGATNVAIARDLAAVQAATATNAQGKELVARSTSDANANLAATNEFRAFSEATAVARERDRANNGATAVAMERDYSEGLRLANVANTIIANDGSVEVAVPLAIRSLRLAYTVDGDLALQRGLDRLFTAHILPHSGELVQSVAITADRRFVLTGGGKPPFGADLNNPASFALRLWNVRDGKLARSFIGHTSTVRSVAISPNGRLVASASDDVSARLWTLATGEQIRELRGHSEPLTKIVFSKSGRFVATASRDRTVILWDSATGAVINTFSGHTETVWDIAFTPDDRNLLSASADGTVRNWEIATGQLVRTYEGVTSNKDLSSLAISGDGKYAASNVRDQTYVWEVASGKLINAFRPRSAGFVYAVTFNAQGTTIGTAHRDGSVRIWSRTGRNELLIITGHDSSVYDLAITADQSLAVTASLDGTARIYDLRKGFLWNATSRRASLSGLTLSPDGSYIGLKGDTSITILNATLRLVAEQPLVADETKLIRASLPTTDGKFVLALTGTAKNLWFGPIAIWQQLEPLLIELESQGATTALISADGKLVAATFEKGVQLWDSASGRLLGDLGPVKSQLLFSPTGDFLVGHERMSGSREATLHVWRTADLARRWSLPTDSIGDGLPLAIDPTSQWLAVGAASGAITIWDLTTGQQKATLLGHRTGINALTFSPDGRMLLSSSGGLQVVGEQTLLNPEVNSPNISIRLWDVATGQERRRFLATGLFNGVAFSSDPAYIIFTSLSLVRRYPVDPGLFAALACKAIVRDLTDVEQTANNLRGDVQACPDLN